MTRRQGPCGFNSKLVRLEATKDNVRKWVEHSFNSKLVRLEDGRVDNLAEYKMLFQFQIGAIRGRLKLLVEEIGFQFQFQIGAIRGSPKSVGRVTI